MTSTGLMGPKLYCGYCPWNGDFTGLVAHCIDKHGLEVERGERNDRRTGNQAE